MWEEHLADIKACPDDLRKVARGGARAFGARPEVHEDLLPQQLLGLAAGGGLELGLAALPHHLQI